MSISHIGHGPTLPIVPQQQSAPASNADATGLDRNLLPDMRKTLPTQAQGVANGLSVQKVFDKLDANGDGTITQAEAGPRWGHGLLGELLKLQETGGQAPATDGSDGSSDGTGATDPGAASPPTGGGTDGTDGTTGADTTAAGSGADTTTAGGDGADSIAGGAGGDTVAGGSDGTDGSLAGDAPPDAGTDLTAGLTPPPPTGDITPDPSQLLDGSAA